MCKAACYSAFGHRIPDMVSNDRLRRFFGPRTADFGRGSGHGSTRFSTVQHGKVLSFNP